MAFGRKVGTMADLKKDLSKGSSTFIKYIPKNGAITVRFIQEPEGNWEAFKEVFDQTRRKSYPVPPDESMPGYPDPDDRVSTRYLANAVDVESDRVIPIQLPKDLANQLFVRYERYETLCDRDYELFRSGEGLDTVYGCTPDSPTAMKLDKYTPLDLEKVLQDAYEAVWGPQAAPAPVTPSGGAGKQAAVLKRKTKIEPEPAEDDDDDLDLYGLAKIADTQESSEDGQRAAEELTTLADAVGVDPSDYGTWAEVAGAIADTEYDDDEPTADLTVEDDVPEEDDGIQNDDDEDEEEGEFWTEDELKPKTIGELRAIAREGGLATSGMKKPEIIKLILNGGEEPF